MLQLNKIDDGDDDDFNFNYKIMQDIQTQNIYKLIEDFKYLSASVYCDVFSNATYIQMTRWVSPLSSSEVGVIMLNNLNTLHATIVAQLYLNELAIKIDYPTSNMRLRDISPPNADASILRHIPEMNIAGSREHAVFLENTVTTRRIAKYVFEKISKIFTKNILDIVEEYI